VPKPLTPTLKGRRVIVIGGGLAGLTAARDLIVRGADVQVVEARERLGGRVWTIHDKAFCDTPLELGGEFIDAGHEEIRALCHEFKLSLQPVLKHGFGLALDINGRVHLSNNLQHVWGEFKQLLSREGEAFNAVACDWSSTIAQRSRRIRCARCSKRAAPRAKSSRWRRACAGFSWPMTINYRRLLVSSR
jgi:monoamine oxidase